MFAGFVAVLSVGNDGFEADLGVLAGWIKLF
jgi:hypothetical protein